MQSAKLVLILVFLSLSSFAQDKRKPALVVIDMQEEFITRGGNDKKPENIKKVNAILAVQLKAIEAATKAGIPIVFMEYEDSGTTNKELVKAAKNTKDVITILKSSDGMFDEYNSHRKELVDFLKSKNINELIITGANGGACVESSIEGALSNEYHVIALDTGIADFNYDDFIYPYENIYAAALQYQCKHCTFKETSDLNEAFHVEKAIVAEKTMTAEEQTVDWVRDGLRRVKQVNEPDRFKGCEK